MTGVALVVSRADRASEHIGERLLEVAAWDEHEDTGREDGAGGGTYYRRPGFELRTFDGLHLHLDGVAGVFVDPSLLCFLSRHSGDTGPLLSAHFTGNFGPAEYGGREGELARACPNAQKRVLGALDDHAPEGYDVGIECTHHGPSRVGVPSMFVELGSGPDEWNDPEGAEAVARAVLALEGVEPDRADGKGETDDTDGGGVGHPSDGVAGDADGGTRHVVGFGGGHYAPRFERIVRETDWAVGHVGADWPLESMGHPREHDDVIRAAFEASAADLAVIDGDHAAVADVVESAGYRVVSETFLRATSGVPRALVSSLEAALGPVDEGLRFGGPARVGLGADAVPFEVVDLPDDLLEAALGVDRDGARAAVDEHAIGYLTEEGGRRPAGRAALPRDGAREAASGHAPGRTDGPDGRAGSESDPDGLGHEDGDGIDATELDASDRLIDALCDVLREGYDDVTREGRVVVARESAFDPAAAADLGVEEGPAFGRLAAGESVEVDGRPIDPDEVHRERVVRFQV
jgi:D-aminoacyl-tRNA deacylase